MPLDLALVGLAALPACLYICAVHRQTAWVLFLASAILPLTQVGLDTRPLTAVIAGAQLLVVLRGKGLLDVDASASAVLKSYWFIVLFFVGTILWSIERTRTSAAAASWIIVLSALTLFARTVPARDRVRGIQWALATVLFLSAAATLSGLPSAFEGGRAVGIMTNANGLGVVCVLAAPLLVLHPKRLFRFSAWIVIAYLIGASDSRGGLLGATAGVAILLWSRLTPAYRVLVLGPLVAGALYVSTIDFATLSPGSGGLLRTNNSREAEWRALIDVFLANPFAGTGFGSQSGLGSSYFKLAAETGILGLALGSLFLWRVSSVVRHYPVALAVLGASLVNAAFEGWVFAAGSAYAVILAATLVAAAGTQPVSQSSAKIGISRREARA